MSILFEGTHQRGFGTWPLKGEQCLAAIGEAIEVGYRAIDTAQMYANEADVGEALANCGVPREQLCVTTKVTPGNFGNFMPSVEKSLKDLRLDKVDLLLLHWPDPAGDNAEALSNLEAAHKAGLASNVGVSNYTSRMLRAAKEQLDVPLSINQVEFHPLLNQDVLLAASKETGIPLSAYCSAGRGEVAKQELLAEIGEKHGKSAVQVGLRWIYQKGVAVITMSTKPENIRANFDIVDFDLTDDEMESIEGLTKANYRIVTDKISPWAPEWD